ncbi:MAG: sigma-70 family RNA polymerase sigma factor [Pseudomonadota bacterium]
MSEPRCDGWERFWCDGQPTGSDRQKIITQCIPLVQRIARQTYSRLPSVVDLDDLVGYGTLGLIHAVDRFRPMEGGGFLRYATVCIRGSILEGLRTMDWAGASRRQWERTVQEAVRWLSSRTGRRPELEEIAAHLEMSIAQFHRARQRLHPDFLVYLNDLVEITGDGFDPLEMMVDASAEPVEEVVNHDLEMQRLEELVSNLPQRERNSIRLFHLEWFNTSAIARVMGVSQARVYQNLNAGVARLKKRVAMEGGGIEDP